MRAVVGIAEELATFMYNKNAASVLKRKFLP